MIGCPKCGSYRKYLWASGRDGIYCYECMICRETYDIWGDSMEFMVLPKGRKK